MPNSSGGKKKGVVAGVSSSPDPASVVTRLRGKWEPLEVARIATEGTQGEDSPMGIFHSPQCVVCGRSVRGLEDARKEGKLWFCSPSHHLSYRGPSEAKTRKRTGRRIVKWVVIVFALLIVLALIPAFVGKDKVKTTSSTNRRTSTVRNTQNHPVPLSKVGGAYGGWRLRVTAVRPSAVLFLGDNYLGYERQRVPPEGQDFMVSVVAKFTGGGRTSTQDLFERVSVTGVHNVAYQPDAGDLNCARTVPRKAEKVTRPLNEASPLCQHRLGRS